MALRACTVCGAKYETKRPDSSKYCSTRCKNRKLRGAGPPDDALAPVVDLPVKASSVVAATRAELDAVGRLNTHLGQAALALAERIDNATAVMGFAALVRELRDTMVEAVKDAGEQHADAADEIRAAALRLIGSA